VRNSFLYFKNFAGLIVNNKGEMKGQNITGSAKQCAMLLKRLPPTLAPSAEEIITTW
jgi:ribosomal protein L14